MNGCPIERATEPTWRDIVHPPIRTRERKPRVQGLTMVMDKGMGPAQFRDLLCMAADFIDFIKLGFGTSVLYSESTTLQKITAARELGIEVYPGGTLFELAYYQGRTTDFFARARILGFKYIEISNGTVDIVYSEKARLIERALAQGFGVLTEVGKKLQQAASPQQMLDEINADLACGASYVIVEGRESGRGAGIYDTQGQLMETAFHLILAGTKQPTRVIWEAPLPSQQRDLIIRIGPDVNLGNIQPTDVIALEALRRGLRSDTFAQTLKTAAQSNSINGYEPPRATRP